MNEDLELVIDRPMPGHFYWTLVRARAAEVHEVVDHARGPMPSEAAATAQGMAVLRDYQREPETVSIVHSQVDPAWNVVTEPGSLM